MRKNLSFSTGFIFLSLVLVIAAIFNTSCTKPSEFTIGKNFLESETNVTIIDTFKTNVSTIFIDSLISSGTGIGYIGYYRDSVFGSVNCETYFDLAYTEFNAPGDRASFDSASFIFTYSKAGYGDTTSATTFEIHELTENITPFTDTYLYNNSHFPYAPRVLGSLKFYPSPNSTDTLIRVNINTYGEQLFELIKTGDERLATEDQFRDYIKGFVLVADTTDSHAVIGLKAEKNHIQLKIYYHFEDVGPSEKEITINMGSASNQFNHVITDFSGTPLDGIKTSHIYPSSRTNNKAYMQGLVGLIPKIQFPTVENLFLENQWKILKAELVVTPATNSFDVFPLPPKMYIFDTDKSNILKNILTDSQGNPLTAVFYNDVLYNQETRYTYGITNFMNSELSDSYFDYNHALAIGLNETGLKSTLNRLLVECKNPPVKLRLYYLTY